MRILLIIGLLLPVGAFSKQMLIDILPSYPLTVTNAKLICDSLYANLPSESIIKLGTATSSGNAPYSCELSGTHLKITLILQ